MLAHTNMTDTKTILIVDDSKVSRMMIKAIIKDHHPSWVMLEAGSADEAIEINKQHSIDYFSVDLNMPGRDGLELISIFKSTNTSGKYALLTANIQEQIKQNASDLGVNCINKPITEISIGKMLVYFND